MRQRLIHAPKFLPFDTWYIHITYSLRERESSVYGGMLVEGDETGYTQDRGKAGDRRRHMRACPYRCFLP